MADKIVIAGALCLVMLLSVPLVTSDLIVYPKEEGPYTVFIGGASYGGGVSKSLFYNATIGLQFGPWCAYRYPYGPEYNMLNRSIFIVNGKLQTPGFPAQIGLKGLKGFAPAVNLLTFKIFTGGRLRVFGVCEELWVWYGLETK